MKGIMKVNKAIQSLLDKKIRDSKGFTIIELLLVVLLMVVVVTLVSGTYLMSINASKDIIDITTNEIDARVVVYRITKDLREAIDISTAKDDEIIFMGNVDVDEDMESVRYYVQLHDDGYYELYRQIDSGEAAEVAEYVIDADIFTYYTGVNTPEGGLTTPVVGEDKNDIRLIDINISIDQNGEETGSTMDMDTIIYLRN
jgi:competence protein ComGC